MFFVSVDLLRALACIMIFLYHCNTFLPGEWKFLTLLGEDIGNNLFFMISGFTLYRSVTAAPFKDFAPWYAKRLYRILPLLVLAYAASGISGFYTFSDKAQLFTVFVYPTLYWFVTGIIAFYPVLFVTGKLIKAPYSLVFLLLILILALQRTGTVECHYITGFFAMYTGFCLAWIAGKRETAGKAEGRDMADGFVKTEDIAEDDGVLEKDGSDKRDDAWEKEDTVRKGNCEKLSAALSFWICAVAMLPAYLVAKKIFPGAVSLVMALMLCVFLLMAFVYTEDKFRAFADKRKGLYVFLRHLGNMALVVYLVQCFNGGIIGYTIGLRVRFPFSFFVNLVMIWLPALILYFADRRIFGRDRK